MYPVRCKHLEPLLTGFKVTTTGGASATIDTGSNDFSSVSCDGAGVSHASQAETGIFARGPLVVGSPAENIGDGGFCCQVTAPGSDIIHMKSMNKTPAGDDGSAYVLALGFGNADTDRYTDAQIVKATFKDPQLLAFRVTNNGTAAIASGGTLATVSRASAGLVTLTFVPTRANYRSAVAIPINAASFSARVTAFDGASVTVKTTDTDGAATDSDFIVFCLFSGLTDESGRASDQLRCPQLYPELVAGRVAYDSGGGTYSLSIGGATNGVDGAVTKNGTGDVSVVLTDPFLRALLVIPTAKTSGKRAQLLATPTTDTFRVGIFTADPASPVAADDTFDFIVLGYNADSSQEF